MDLLSISGVTPGYAHVPPAQARYTVEASQLFNAGKERGDAFEAGSVYSELFNAGMAKGEVRQ